jgi:hypothetical protein
MAGEWSAAIHPGWDIGGNAKGGYLLALSDRALAGATEILPSARREAVTTRPRNDAPLAGERSAGMRASASGPS